MPVAYRKNPEPTDYEPVKPTLLRQTNATETTIAVRAIWIRKVGASVCRTHVPLYFVPQTAT
jgi:hypothetical protein